MTRAPLALAALLILAALLALPTGLASARRVNWYEAESHDLTGWTVGSGDLSDTYSSNDVRVRYDEANGTTNQVVLYKFNSYGHSSVSMTWEGYYTGGHSMTIDCYNGSGWTTLETITSSSSADETKTAAVPANCLPGSGSERLQIRLDHASGGNQNHDLFTDHIFLTDTSPTSTPTATSAPTSTPTATSAPTSTPTATPTPSLITYQLVSCWNLDESSGVRLDSYGANDLTDTNTVGSIAGKVGNAAFFVAENSERLTRTDNASLSIDGAEDISLAFWFQTSSLPTTMYPLGKYSSLLTPEYLIAIDTYRVKWYLYNPSHVATTVTSRSIITNGLWYFIVAYYDRASQLQCISINNESPNCVTADSTYDSTSPFALGAGIEGYYSTVLFDAVSFWSRDLSLSEISWLYNSGAGRSCSDITAVATPTPVTTVVPTSTPDYISNITLSSGNHAHLTRELSFGDIAIIISILVFFAFALILGMVEFARK